MKQGLWEKMTGDGANLDWVFREGCRDEKGFEKIRIKRSQGCKYLGLQNSREGGTARVLR